MAQYFRFYQKKRRHRRTGSKKLGSIGEAVFFAVLLVLGCAGLAALVWTLVVPEWRVHHEFVRDLCTVQDKRLGQIETDKGPLFRPEVLIEYHVDGQTYRQWTYDIRTLRGEGYSPEIEESEVLLDCVTLGSQYPFWYDPMEPGSAVIARGSEWWIWLTFLVPAAFLVIGSGGLIYQLIAWGKSAERRSALKTKTARIAKLGTNGNSNGELPHIPDSDHTTDSPGTRLRFRLPIASSPGGALIVWLLVCTGWNAIISVFVVIAVHHHLTGHPDWILTCFTIPFALVGIGLIAFFVRQLVVTTGIGPTLVEISDQPLHPGCQYDLFVQQAGRLTMTRLEVLLICMEEASFRHGTDTRTESRRVFERELLHCKSFEIRQDEPLEADCQLEIPATAMHSFKSGHNEIHWQIVVEGEAVGWPRYSRSFPLIIHPNANGKETP